MNKIRILELDIETSPALVYVWNLWKPTIAINQIVEPTRVLCWAARWQGERKIMFSSEHMESRNKMLLKIYALLDEADAVVHYNGRNFDRKHLNREFIELGWTPPSPARDIDLLLTVRRNFKFLSNKLAYITEQLELGSKVKHQGMDLWVGCLQGDATAWRKMKNYNMQDVRLLRNLYQLLQPWIVNHPNHALWVEDDSKPVCRVCASKNVIRKGEERTNVLVYQRYKCKDCGANLRGRKRLRTSGEGVLV